MKKIITLIIFIFCVSFLGVQSTYATTNLSAALDKVVMIISMDENYQPIGIGSGFVIGNNGEIATNYHVVEGASSAMAKFVNQEEKYSIENIVQSNTVYDIAIIQINTKTSPISLGDDEISSIGERIYAIGNPEGLEGTVSEGIISGFRKIDNNFRIMQITAPISPGSSGGPVINQNGQVIGIASASNIEGQNLNFAIPVTKLKEVISKPKINIPFKQANLPIDKNSQMTQHSEDTNLVKVFNIKIGTRYTNGTAHINFSVRNNTRRDIKNIKLIISWKLDSGEIVHFSPVLVEDTIPSLQTKIINKSYLEGVGKLPHSGYKAEARIVDYEILETSGSMEFK